MLKKALSVLTVSLISFMPLRTAWSLPDWDVESAEKEMHALAQGQAAQKPATIKVRSDLVLMDVSIREKGTGKPKTDLKKEDFELYEDKQQRDIAHFSLDEYPLAVAIVMDKSDSLSPYVNLLLAASERTLSLLKKDDLVSLYAFNFGVDEIVPLTKDRQRIREGIRTIRTWGATNINDAIYLVAKQLKLNAPADSRKVIILVSDDEATFICNGKNSVPPPPQQQGPMPGSRGPIGFPIPIPRIPIPTPTPMPGPGSTDPEYQRKVDEITAACKNSDTGRWTHSAHHKEVVETALETDVTVYNIKVPGENIGWKIAGLASGGWLDALAGKVQKAKVNVKDVVEQTGGDLFEVKSEGPSGSSGSSSPNDDDRPTLTRAPGAQPQTAPRSSGSSNDDWDREDDGKNKSKTQTTQPVQKAPESKETKENKEDTAKSDPSITVPGPEGRPHTVFTALQTAIDQLRHRYTIGFYPPSPANNNMEPGQEFRKLTLKLHDKGLKNNYIVRTRKGYYPKPRLKIQRSELDESQP